MNPKSIRLLAILATCLIIVSGIHALLKRPQPNQAGPLKRPTGVVSNNTSGKRKVPQAELPCTIRRAAFGGTQTSLLRLMKGKVAHYVVLDHPHDNPMVPFYQRDWLEANYGVAEPPVVGEFATVEEAIAQAAILCKRN
jgi:hypothetical protein